MTPKLPLPVTLACALVLAACGDGGAGPELVADASLQLVAGADQSAAAGQPVPIPPAVRVHDGAGKPVRGATVRFTVADGGGEVAGGTATSDAAGVARAGGWTLGTRAGANRLLASVGSSEPVVFMATGLAGPPAALARSAGDGQAAPAGQVLPIAPAVTVSDGFGNPVPNVEVSFTAGAGVLTGNPAVSDSAGVARVGAWRLGPVAGTQTLEARAGTLAVTFTATATAGQPAVVQVAAGQDQTATAGTAVPVRPAVRVLDGGGNAATGVTVRFAVSLGGGVVSGATVLTGSDGVATAGNWTLGSAAGSNRLTATVTGVGTVTFNATGVPGPAARLVKAAGDDQSVTAGTVVPVSPTVRVTDANGNGVRDVLVTFTASAGSNVSPATQKTGAAGTASAGRWLLADEPGVNTLQASVAGVGNVTFTATGIDYAVPTPPFDIELRFLTAVSAAQRAALENAAARWETVIIADLPNGFLSTTADECGAGTPALAETIDDLVVFVTLEPIDGVGSVLGSAGPCYIRSLGSLPLLGRMRFDTADLDALEQSGRLQDVMLHELGHVLGIGTLWSNFGLLQAAGTADPFFTGVVAGQGFVLAGGSLPPGYGVPVENSGNAGTRDAHWRESVLRTELMTGWISAAGTPNPLSAITIGSLRDLGYTVDPARADPFTIPAAAGYELETPSLHLLEQPLPPPRVAR